MPTTGADGPVGATGGGAAGADGAVPARTIDVVAGVIFDAARARVLLALRRADQHQGGLWEFPGGKVDAGEALVDALRRELDEELGIRAGAVEPRCTLEHAYPDKTVRLHVFDVLGFEGEPVGREGQELRWTALDALGSTAFPAANAPIVAGLVTPGSGQSGPGPSPDPPDAPAASR